jgi:hypothetical protein
MNINYRDLLPEGFEGSSRVWIYQSSRIFTMSEALEIEEILESFISKWQAHGQSVKGFGTLFFGQFIVLIADETITEVSGCSTDSSVKVIKQIESNFNVSMFDRQLLAFLIKDRVQLIPMSQVNYAVDNGILQASSLFFNNAITNLSDFSTKWISPIKETWLASRLKAMTS